MWPGTESNCRHEDFQSPERVPGLCVTIGRQLNEFERLKSLRSRSIYRLDHIGANSSGKVVAKSAPASSTTILDRFRCLSLCDFCITY